MKRYSLMLTAVIVLGLYLGGCALPSKTQDIDPPKDVSGSLVEDVHIAPSPISSSSQPWEGLSFHLPEAYDPLGIIGDVDVFELPADRIAEKYGARRKEVPNVYAINGLCIGGDEFTQMRIQTKNGKIEQVMTTMSFLKAASGYEDMYLQMEKAFGKPSAYYEWDDEWNLQETDAFHEETKAVWKLSDKTIEISTTPPTYVDRGAYIAAYREKMDETYLLAWYDYFSYPRETIKRERNWDFDPTGIFRDQSVFSLQADEVIQKYQAVPGIEDTIHEVDYEGPPRAYEVKGIVIEGCETQLLINAESNQIFSVEYKINVLDKTQQEIDQICERIRDGVTSALASEFYSRHLDVDAWHLDNHRRMGLKYESGSGYSMYDQKYEYANIVLRYSYNTYE